MKSDKAIKVLTDQVQELLTLLESCPTPDTTHLRSRIEESLDSAQRAIARSKVRARLGRYAASVDHYVTGYPRLGFLTGIALGGALVYLAGGLRSQE
jgi:ElaB/YqjD/DUF883 family membrane-anchored ribosome-binding protein